MAGWVCPECGLDYDTISPKDAAVAVRSYPRRYRAQLTTLGDDENPDSVIRRRPAPGVWSALEYTAHLVDVFDDLEASVRRITTDDEPVIVDGWDPDERAVQSAYNEQDPAEVLARLQAAADRLAATMEGVAPDDWRRIGHFPYGDRDALTMARNAVHEGYHHLRDVERGLRAVRGRPVVEEE